MHGDADIHALLFASESDGAFLSFDPYVPAIDARGAVAFQARCRDGSTCVVVHDGRRSRVLRPHVDGHPFDVVSHPAINGRGDLVLFGRDASGRDHLLLHAHNAWQSLADGCGPLGPTMNERGEVAFRGMRGGQPAILRAGGGLVATLATGPTYHAFHGLPVIASDGAVVFAADRASGERAILRVAPAGESRAPSELIASSTDGNSGYRELARFPCLGPDDAACVSAIRRDGAPVVCIDAGKAIVEVDCPGFESVRGVLADRSGGLVLIATPRAAPFGVYRGADPRRLVIGLGSEVDGSPVTDFALNPVSINARGQLAVRVLLGDGRHAIVRVDPG